MSLSLARGQGKGQWRKTFCMHVYRNYVSMVELCKLNKIAKRVDMFMKLYSLLLRLGSLCYLGSLCQ